LWNTHETSNEQECDLAYEDENVSLKNKICGYCYTKCQQHLGSCLLSKINEVLDGSVDLCQKLSDKCQKRCLKDKHIGKVAEANWPKVVKILGQFKELESMYQ
ncbi:unnamed protein product, partial [Didymodactylos carnosus]